jgi:hypothetical protein
MAGIDHLFRANAADVAGASRNEYVHGKLKATPAFKSRAKNEAGFEAMPKQRRARSRKSKIKKAYSLIGYPSMRL